VISEDERYELNAYLDIANMWSMRANYLASLVEQAFELGSMKGFDPMPAFNFSTQGLTPKFGGGGGLPIGKHPVVIFNTKMEATSSGTGGKLVLELEVIDGPMKGAKGVENLTLQHANPVVVRISSEQLTAICHVVGLPNGFQQTEELHGKPFVVEVAPQKDKPEYTEVIAVFDMQGNEPGKQTGGGQGGGNAGNFGGNNNAQGGGNFGGNNAGGNAQGGGQAQGGGWGGNAGGNAGGGAQGGDNGQNGGQGGGWQQGGGAANAGGGGGGWGAR